MARNSNGVLERQEVVVKHDTEDEVPTEILARSIVDVAEAAQKLLNGRLNRRAIVTLIQDSVPYSLPRKTIEDVLNAAAELKKNYVRA